MANKTQAKAAIDAAVVLIKADIDTILPVGVNITDGAITFGPTRWSILLDAGGSSVTAESLTTSIVTNLNAAARPTPVVTRIGRRSNDPEDSIEVSSGQSRFRITNFNF